MARRLYFLKMPNLANDIRFKPLLRKKDGDTLFVTLLCLTWSLMNEGLTYRFCGDEETLEDELAVLVDRDVETIKALLAYLFRKNLAEMLDEKTFHLSCMEEYLGSEADSAERMRRLRERAKSTSNGDDDVSQSDESASHSDVIKKRKETEKDQNRQEADAHSESQAPPANAWSLEQRFAMFLDYCRGNPEYEKQFHEAYDTLVSRYPKGKKQGEGFKHFVMLVGNFNPLKGTSIGMEDYSKRDRVWLINRAFETFVESLEERGTEERYYPNLVKFFDETIFDYLDFGALDAELEREQKRAEREQKEAEIAEAGRKKVALAKKLEESFREIGFNPTPIGDCYDDARSDLDYIARDIEKFGLGEITTWARKMFRGDDPNGYDNLHAFKLRKELMDSESQRVGNIISVASWWMPISSINNEAEEGEQSEF